MGLAADQLGRTAAQLHNIEAAQTQSQLCYGATCSSYQGDAWRPASSSTTGQHHGWC